MKQRPIWKKERAPLHNIIESLPATSNREHMKGLIPLAVGCVEQVAALTVVTLSDMKKLDFENIRCAAGFQEPIEEEQSLITRPARDIQMEGFTRMRLMLFSRAPSHGPIPEGARL